MDEQPRHPDRGREIDGAPRWQKVVGIIGVLVLLGLGILIVGGGGHGPARHAPGGDGPRIDAPGDEAPSDHAPPEGQHG